jgi:hypothetical protein
MKLADLKVPVIVLAICFSIGAVIDNFTKIHWLPAGFMVLFALLLNGVAISIEDREPGGWDYVENEGTKEKMEFKKMVRIQAFCTITVFILGLASYVYTSS